MRLFIKILPIFLVAIIISSCGRRMTPSSVMEKNAKDGDKSAFNYVYVEALKQKLMGNSGDALKYFEQALKLNPSSDAACFQIAQILISKENTAGAKAFANRANTLDPSNLWYMMMLSAIYYQERNLDSAVIFYEKAVKVYPERENLQLTLGNLYSENKDFDKALRLYESIEDKYGVNENSTPSLVRSLLETKKYDEALAKVNLLLKDKPDEIAYNGLLAEVYKSKGDNLKAREVYSKLVERNPDDPQILLALCGFLIEEKSYEDLLPLLSALFINDKVSRENKISIVAQLIEDDGS
jgi:predicted Zn-dependent protease